jgi:hypothetical protein
MYYFNFLTRKYKYSLKNNFHQLCPHFRLLSCSLAWQPPYAITKECERTLKLQNQLMSRSRFPALKIYWRCHTVQWVIFDKIFSRARCQKVSEIFAKIMLNCQQNENFTTSNKSYFLKVFHFMPFCSKSMQILNCLWTEF